MLGQRGAAARLGEKPQGLGVVQGRQGVGDAPVGVQDERLDAAVAGRQVREHLAGQGREPGQAVRAGHGHDVAGQGGHRRPGLQEALLAQGVAVVGGDELIGVADGVGDGAGSVQERGGAHQSVPPVLPVLPVPAVSARSAAPGAPAGSSGSSTRPSRPEA